MVKAVITLMCRLLSNPRRGKRPRPSTGLPFVLNVNRIQGWLSCCRGWKKIQDRLRLLWLIIGNCPSSPPVQRSLYALSLLQLICLIWMVKLMSLWGWRGAGWCLLGTIDGNHHTLWIQGHQIDSLDGHCCTSRCVHCGWECFCGEFVQFYVHPYCISSWIPAYSSSASPARQKCVLFTFEVAGQRTCSDLCCVHVDSVPSNQTIPGGTTAVVSAAAFKSDLNLNVLLIPTWWSKTQTSVCS